MANSTLVHNETVKLRATFFNNVAAGTFVAAFLIPGLSHMSGASRSWAIFYGSSGVIICVALHLFARWILRGLRQ